MDNSQLESLLQDLESDILEQNQRTVEQQLASVRFTTRIQTPIFPTNLGALVRRMERTISKESCL